MGPPGEAERPGRKERNVLLALAVLLLVLALLALGSVLQRRPLRSTGHPPPGASTLPPPPASPQMARGGAAPAGTVGSIASRAQPTAGASLYASGTSSPTTAGHAVGQAVSPAAGGSPPVICHSDLALDQSPNAAYNFLCTQNGKPITWAPGQTIDLYTSGLTAVQNSVLTEALSEWETEGSFSVVQVGTPDSANVTIDDAPLQGSEAGSATVRYECTLAACSYAHGTVHLSSTAPLTKTLWASTILHELGHVAGLNHVSRAEEVLYPASPTPHPTPTPRATCRACRPWPRPDRAPLRPAARWWAAGAPGAEEW